MQRIAFFLPNLHGGGAERIAINLLKCMSEKDIPLDLVLADAEGPYLQHVPEQVNIVNLAAGRVLKAILPLSRYLKQNTPVALLSHLNHANLVAILARELAEVKTRLVVVEHDTLSASKPKLFRGRFIKPLMKLLYPRADVIVGVSNAATQDLKSQISLAAEKMVTIYNPVVDSKLLELGKIPLAHPWFQPDCLPVFLAVGRLTAQKDFLTLLKAFALVRKQIEARLLILGEGESRAELEVITNRLGISHDVSMPGFVDNPYTYMSHASAFVLSSRWEGLPTVLIEAMACGCPVISTDCPSGPKEILEAGKYGPLIPVGDELALSQAMLKVLKDSKNSNILREKARQFSFEEATAKYLAILG